MVVTNTLHDKKKQLEEFTVRPPSAMKLSTQKEIIALIKKNDRLRRSREA
jgi:hypothetical protein